MRKSIILILLLLTTITATIGFTINETSGELFTNSLFDDANLLGYYRFEEIDGTTFKNEIFTGTNSLIGSPDLTDGKFNNAINFSTGTNSYASMSDLNLVDPINRYFTINAWVNHDTISQYGVIVGNYDWDVSLYTGNDANTDKAEAYLYDGVSYNDITITGTTTLVTDEWYMLTLVRNNTSIKLYVDGIEEASVTFDYDIDMSGQALLFANDGWGDYFYGSIDDVSIFNRTLTESEIESIYNDGTNYFNNGIYNNTSTDDDNLYMGFIANMNAEPYSFDLLTYKVNPTYSDGKATFDEDDNADAHLFVTKNPINLNESFTAVVKRNNSFAFATATYVNVMSVYQNESQPILENNVLNMDKERINFYIFAVGGMGRLYYKNASRTDIYWDKINGNWSAGAKTGFTGFPNIYYITKIISNGTNFTMRVEYENGTLLEETTPIPWSDVYDDGTEYWFGSGEPYTSHFKPKIIYDYMYFYTNSGNWISHTINITNGSYPTNITIDFEANGNYIDYLKIMDEDGNQISYSDTDVNESGNITYDNLRLTGYDSTIKIEIGLAGNGTSSPVIRSITENYVEPVDDSGSSQSVVINQTCYNSNSTNRNILTPLDSGSSNIIENCQFGCYNGACILPQNSINLNYTFIILLSIIVLLPTMILFYSRKINLFALFYILNLLLLLIFTEAFIMGNILKINISPILQIIIIILAFILVILSILWVKFRRGVKWYEF